MSQPTSRRFFLGAATAVASSRVWGANDKINVGIVGLGGRGTNHLDYYSKNIPEARVAGLCDVNQAAREVAQSRLEKNGGDKATEFEDMRQMFADPAIEAVSIATPNHWHALAAIWAMKAGKDVLQRKARLLQHPRRPADDQGGARHQPHGADRLAAPFRIP